MERLLHIDDCRIWRQTKTQGKRVAFVPTMGALHQGHLALVAKAKETADVVIVSIFVNPTQFDEPGDFENYQIDIESDCAALESLGCDAVFVPPVEEMYPNGYATFVEVVGPLSDKLCGATRPGHFRGVATVVTKLFNIVQPDIAVFGEKDLQQVLIIQRMVSDLGLAVRLLVAPTIREADGVAMSSRNRRLDSAGRIIAQSLPRGLDLANKRFVAGERNALKLCEAVYEELLHHPGVDVDYADVVRLADFSEVEEAQQGDILAAAVFIDGIRLIDHVHLGGPGIPGAVESSAVAE